VTLNARPLDRCWIRHEEIAPGGTLTFTMGAEPSRIWAAGAESVPPS
jgi:putative alpha-1,2-mannosidase